MRVQKVVHVVPSHEIEPPAVQTALTCLPDREILRRQLFSAVADRRVAKNLETEWPSDSSRPMWKLARGIGQRILRVFGRARRLLNHLATGIAGVDQVRVCRSRRDRELRPVHCRVANVEMHVNLMCKVSVPDAGQYLRRWQMAMADGIRHQSAAGSIRCRPCLHRIDFGEEI